MRLRCLWFRLRIGPFLDRALSDSQARGVARHLTRCADCQESARRQERFTALVREAAAVPLEPSWTEFWPGIRARLVGTASISDQPAWAARPAWSMGWLPRLAVGSAVVGALLFGLILWRSEDQRELPGPGIVVRALEVSSPHTSVMVFSPPEQEMTVIWVFGLDSMTDQSLRQVEEVRAAWREPSWSVPSWA